MRKKLLQGLLLLVSLCLLCWTALPGLADFGDFSGDSDFGGSDWDSGSDWDWDSGSDYDSDYDYGSGYSSGYHSGSSSSDDPFAALAAIVILAVIAFVIMRFYYKKAKKSPVRIQRPKQTDLRPISEYSALDPNFDPMALQTKLSNLYVQMQNCWTEKDITPLRPYFTDAYWAQMDRQLNTLRTTGCTNYVERISVLGVNLEGFAQSAGMDRIVATLSARITDYTLSDKTGELIKGDRRAEKFMTYEYTLIRPTGATTQAEGGLQTVNCPNCGAPLNLNATAKCPYCGSVVTVDANDFMISNIRAVAQETR